MNCDNLIKGNIERNCADPMAQGIEREAYIINRSQVDFGHVEFAEGSQNMVSAFPLKPGAQAYKVIQSGTQPFSGTAKTIEAGTASMGATVTTVFHLIIPNNSPAICENIIDPMLEGEFVVIWQNKHKNLRDETSPGAAAYEIAGFYQGLVLSEGGREVYSDETGGGWAVTLQEARAPRSAIFLYAGSLEATETMIQTMLAPAEKG